MCIFWFLYLYKHKTVIMKTPQIIVDEALDIYEEVVDHWCSEYKKSDMERLEKLSIPLDEKFKSKMELIKNLFKEILG